MQAKKKKLTCQRCGYVWKPRAGLPKGCASCESLYWNIPCKKRNCTECGLLFISPWENQLYCQSKICKQNAINRRLRYLFHNVPKSRAKMLLRHLQHHRKYREREVAKMAIRYEARRTAEQLRLGLYPGSGVLAVVHSLGKAI